LQPLSREVYNVDIETRLHHMGVTGQFKKIIKNILLIENVAYLCSPKFLKGRRYL
jgi:hypothetical protein